MGSVMGPGRIGSMGMTMVEAEVVRRERRRRGRWCMIFLFFFFRNGDLERRAGSEEIGWSERRVSRGDFVCVRRFVGTYVNPPQINREQERSVRSRRIRTTAFIYTSTTVNRIARYRHFKYGYYVVFYNSTPTLPLVPVPGTNKPNPQFST